MAPTLKKKTFPPIIELIDDSAIIDMLAEETRQH
jgi:AbiU2